MTERRVLHVIRSAGYSGAEKHLTVLVEELREHGWRSDVVLAAPDSACVQEFDRRLTDAGAAVTVVVMPGHISPKLLRELRRRIRRGGYDLVHTHLVHADWHAGLASLWAGGAPVISTKHNHDRFREKRWFARSEAFWMRRSPATIAISGSLADFTERHTGLRPTVVRYGLQGVELSESPPLSDEDDGSILALGRLEPQKGFDVLIDAMDDLRRRRTRLPHLRIAGEGSQRSRLEEQIGRLELDEYVELMGRRPDPERLLGEAAMLVHPARWEGFGMVLLEAMQAARPVIATRVGAIPEVVEHERTGILVAPDDPAALATAIEQLAGDPSLARRFGVAGHERLLQEFSPERMAAETVEVYERVVNARARDAGPRSHRPGLGR